MIHQSMTNDSRVADELYIKRVLLALEDFLFFSLYSFSCIAKQVTTLNQFRLLSGLVLSCLDFLEMNLEPFAPLSILYYCYQYHLRPTPPDTLERVLQHRTWYWMCLHPSTGCKYCSEFCSVSCWVYLVLATVPDRHFGSGSGSEPNRCQIGGPGCQ
jgi:hypothetical protein